MPEYIRPANTSLMQAFIDAQRRKDERPGDTKRAVGNAAITAVANIVNQHYKDKEMKLMQAKSEKEKELMGLVDYLQKNNILQLPAGATGETSVQGYTKIPSGMQEMLKNQGISAQYSQPRESKVPESTLTPERYAQVITAYKDKPEILKKLNSTLRVGMGESAYIKAFKDATQERTVDATTKPPTGYRYTDSGILEAIPGGPADVKNKTAQDKPTVAQTVVDRLFAKTYEDYIASGGYADLISQIDSLSEVKKALQAGKDNLTGPAIGNLPLSARAIKYPESIKVQEQAEQTIQRTLRTTLGAQFTEKEGMLFMRRGYNPTLKESINVQKIDEMIAKLKVVGEAKRAAVEYYEQNGTLTGYKGKIYRFNEKGELITVAPTVKSITGQAPPAKGATPAKAAPKDDLDKALDDLGI